MNIIGNSILFIATLGKRNKNLPLPPPNLNKLHIKSAMKIIGFGYLLVLGFLDVVFGQATTCYSSVLEPSVPNSPSWR
jgi:hypothetical protein